MTKRRSAAQLARDSKIISSMYLRGEYQAVIAERTGLSQGTISNTLKNFQKQWLSDSMMDFNEARSRELAKIDDLEKEYWDAWKRSQENAETRTETETEKGSSTTFKEEGQVGNPSFLNGIEWCINKRCEILGLNAPNRNINVNLDLLSMEQLQRLAEGEDIVSVLAT